jgi:hypothetical protein
MTKSKEEIEVYVNRRFVDMGIQFRFEILSLPEDGGVLYQVRPLEMENPEYLKATEIAAGLLDLVAGDLFP